MDCPKLSITQAHHYHCIQGQIVVTSTRSTKVEAFLVMQALLAEGS